MNQRSIRYEMELECLRTQSKNKTKNLRSMLILVFFSQNFDFFTVIY